jgi:nitrogen fixation protein
VQVTAPPHAVRVSDEQTRAVSGAYALSNGWRLHVRPALNGVVARIDDQKPMRLIALSPDKYVTRDGNVAMEFNRGADGDEMMMSYVPDPRLAEVVVVTSAMASR